MNLARLSATQCEIKMNGSIKSEVGFMKCITMSFIIAIEVSQ